MLIKCKDMPVAKIALHHVDFKYNNFETLAWYGISKDTFFNSDGTYKLNTLGIKPTKNLSLVRGENLHIYMGTTGANSARIHTHISTWFAKNGTLVEDNPRLYLDCTIK
jgi:hypothetical protein